MVISTPMMVAVQGMCARIGDVTEKGLATVLRENFPRWLVYLVEFLLVANAIAMIGADLIGVSSAVQLITGIKYTLWIVPVSMIVWFAVLFTRFQVLERVIGLLTLVFLAYFVSAVLAKPNWLDVIKAFVLPTIQMNRDFLFNAVGVLGATFTPPLFFWQAKEEVEDQKDEPRPEQLWRARRVTRSIAPGFIFSQLITVFIMISTATVLFTHHKMVKTAADAAAALRPVAGPYAEVLFAVGIIGAGLVSIPVLAASTGYMVAETFQWKDSLSDKIDAAKGFYVVITLALFAGAEIALTGIDPVSAMFYSQAMGGFVGPVLLTLLMIIANRKRVMGKQTNGWFSNLFGVLSLVVLIASAAAFVIQQISGG
jgi:NRAMP (natural resistance-associated macrophage protein)-like metal ion transporter